MQVNKVSPSFNIYCDESCHLENDRLPIMVLGAVWCPTEKVREISKRIREIKSNNGLPRTFEVKWSKVSPSKKDFYLNLLDYFFEDSNLHFRALIVPDKSKLRHEDFGQDHDTLYYKMYFILLQHLLSPQAEYKIYLDIKDTRSAAKMFKLHGVLCRNMYDFERRIVARVQTVHSHEVEEIQLADLLAGVVGYANRGLTSNEAKLALVNRMKERSHYTLTNSTLYREEKVNLFRWTPEGGV